MLSVNDEGANDVTFTNPNYDVSGISDFALLDNNAVLIANGVDELMIYQDNNTAIFETNYSDEVFTVSSICLLYTSPSPRDVVPSRMPSSA